MSIKKIEEICGEWHLVSTTVYNSVYRNASIEISPEKAVFVHYDHVEGEKSSSMVYNIKCYDGSLKGGCIRFTRNGPKGTPTLDAFIKLGKMMFVKDNGAVSIFKKVRGRTGKTLRVTSQRAVAQKATFSLPITR
jgi:hypothetical protein